LLVRALNQKNTTHRQCLTVFVDDGLIVAWPYLKRNIQDYVNRYHHYLRLVASPISVPGGERCKNEPEVLQEIYRRLYELQVDRHAVVLAIGGGAVLDAVGFAAATTHRGIRLVRLPSTVLAQNDSGVGVKTGINLFGLKNFIGTFTPPYAVINDSRFLETLSSRDRRSGVAEAVKVALIKDLDFFEWLERHALALQRFDRDTISCMIRHCAELHLNHIVKSGDPFEAGNARPLDHGHWAAHKLESLTKHEMKHGEAVAIGIALDTRYAAQTGLLQEGTEERIYNLLETLGFQLWHSAMLATSPDGSLLLTDGLREFREHLGGALSVTLLTKIGESVEVHEMNHREIERAINWLKARYKKS
jgi:3-dehydroquinate synthase